MASIWTLQSRCVCLRPLFLDFVNLDSMCSSSNVVPFPLVRVEFWSPRTTVKLHVSDKCLHSFRLNSRRTKLSCYSLNANEQDTSESVNAQDSDESDAAVDGSGSKDVVFSKHSGFNLQQHVSTGFPVVKSLIKRFPGEGSNFPIWIWFCVATSCLVLAVRVYVNFANKSGYKRHVSGSVADLIRRGQLKSDRRGISRPLKYEDPFNNPLVKVGKGSSTVEMCGKVYRLAPVTLTQEQQAVHQKRRSRAYQWKRPTMFLKEGDIMPPDVDPDTIRWIPANHPFATTVSDIDEDLAQTNVHQKHGVPFRIKAEHEALQKKLESLQKEQKFEKLVLDPATAKDFERPFKSQLQPQAQAEKTPSNDDPSGSSTTSGSGPNYSEGKQSSKEKHT